MGNNPENTDGDFAVELPKAVTPKRNEPIAHCSGSGGFAMPIWASEKEENNQ